MICEPEVVSNQIKMREERRITCFRGFWVLVSLDLPSSDSGGGISLLTVGSEVELGSDVGACDRGVAGGLEEEGSSGLGLCLLRGSIMTNEKESAGFPVRRVNGHVAWLELDVLTRLDPDLDSLACMCS